MDSTSQSGLAGTTDAEPAEEPGPTPRQAAGYAAETLGAWLARVIAAEELLAEGLWEACSLELGYVEDQLRGVVDRLKRVAEAPV